VKWEGRWHAVDRYKVGEVDLSYPATRNGFFRFLSSLVTYLPTIPTTVLFSFVNMKRVWKLKCKEILTYLLRERGSCAASTKGLDTALLHLRCLQSIPG